MFEAGDIREWRGHDVVDPDGHKIGELEAVYVDTSTDLPAFGTVKVGMLYLLIVGVVFLGALLLGALRMRRRPGKPPAR
jgi:hypothetical protein